jgi:general secretion pathway protein D
MIAEATGGAPGGLEIPPGAGNSRVAFVGPASVRSGEEFVLDVTVEEMRNLYSAPLFVNFNPKVLEFVRADEGDFLKAAGQTTVFSTSVDSQAGRLIIGYKQGVGGKGASGNGILFRLRFRGKAAGRGDVNLDRINFRDPSGNRLAVPRAEKVIEVR